MRVLIVTTWYPSARNPVSGAFVRRDAELIAREHDVQVVHLISPGLVAPEDLEADRFAFVPVTRLPMSTSDPIAIRCAWLRLAPLLAGRDLLHTHAFSTLLPFAGRRVDLPWVHTEHWSGVADPTSLGLAERFVLGVGGRLLRRPDVVSAVSEHLAAKIRRHRPAGRIAVVPPVVPFASPVPAPRDPARPQLVAVGGLVPGKRPGLALDIVRELRVRGRSATLTWVGDGPLRETLQSVADGLARFPGAADPRGVSAALDAADLFLLPTRGETLCLSALEAIAHGRPVVMGDRGGQREYVTPANGALVAGGEASAYADAVEAVLRATASTPAAEIAATIAGRFDEESVRRGTDAVYEEAIIARREIQ